MSYSTIRLEISDADMVVKDLDIDTSSIHQLFDEIRESKNFYWVYSINNGIISEIAISNTDMHYSPLLDCYVKVVYVTYHHGQDPEMVDIMLEVLSEVRRLTKLNV